MPRISRETAAAKQSFVRNLILADSTVTNQTIQAKLKEQFGGLMNAETIKAIRAEVVTPGSAVVAQQTETHLDGPMPDLTPKADSTQPVVAPEPVMAAEKVVEKVDPVVTVVDLVTDERGSYIRTPTPTEGKEVTLRPGLVEVVK
jgi:hypothetical protein